MKPSRQYEWQIDLDEFLDLAETDGHHRRSEPSSTKLLTVNAREFYELSKKTGTLQRTPQRTSRQVAILNRTHSIRLTASQVDPITLLDREMRAWGITKESALHVKFHTRHINKLKSILSWPIFKEREVIPAQLSGDPKDCIMQVLRQEINLIQGHDDHVIKARDLLPQECVGAPYFWKSSSDTLELRAEFRIHAGAKLDPLRRFVPVSEPVEEFFRSNWTSYHGYQASAFRALVGYEACRRPCISCRSTSVRWNLSTRHQPHWVKLHCTHCQSTYDVKTPEKHTTLLKRLSSCQYHNMSYYDEYHALDRKLHRPTKRYIVLATTDISSTARNIVWVGEITGIEPRLQDRSFLSREDNDFIRIYSRVKFSTCKEWFDLSPDLTGCVEKVHAQVQTLLNESFQKKPSKASDETERFDDQNNLKHDNDKSDTLARSFGNLNISTGKVQVDDDERRRILRRKRNRLAQLKKLDPSKWSQEDRTLIEQEDDVLRQLAKEEALLKIRQHNY